MKIFVDKREKESMVNHLKELSEKYKFEVEEQQLLVGDYTCEGKHICIERKTIQDAYSSITSQHLFDQAKNMMENYEDRYLLISGSFKQLIVDPNLFNVSIHVYLGALASLSAKYGLKIITCENDKQLAYLVYKLCEKSGEVPDVAPVKRLTVSAESLKVAAVTACRGFSTEKANKVLEKYPTISMLCSATVEELQEIDGIGPKLAENLKEVFA